jgi:hypothetical protein
MRRMYRTRLNWFYSSVKYKIIFYLFYKNKAFSQTVVNQKLYNIKFISLSYIIALNKFNFEPFSFVLSLRHNASITGYTVWWWSFSEVNSFLN